jgi:L-ascorbate metabolism protein UlaG (beta-lactamase superfamily)
MDTGGRQQEIEDRTRAGTTLWYLGGPSIAVCAKGKIIYVDPFFGPSVNPLWTRRFEPLIDPGRIRGADCVLITHEHRDHCNEATLRALEQNVRPGYFLPGTSLELIRQEYHLDVDPRRVHIVKAGDRFSTRSFRLDVLDSSDRTAREAVSYLITTEDGKVFHAGDSLYAPSFFAGLREYAVDVAFLPLGKNPEGWNVYPGAEGFTQMASEIGARVTVPVHWDLWEESYLDPHSVALRSRETEIRVLPRGSKIVLPLDKG